MREYSDFIRMDPTGISPPGAADGGHDRAWVEVSARFALDGPAGPFRLDLDLTVERGAFVALTGPSGAGKTTLLRLLAGLAVPDEGRVRVGSSTWCDTGAGLSIPVRHRSIGFVFQDYALFPNMSVLQNVEYAIGARKARDEARALLELVGLEGLANAYPARLSGGQKQRLALIRAVARKPAILMLDEPLSALDPDMRRQLQDEVKRLHRAFGTTTFLVSHDTAEILRLADRVIRLKEGRVVYDGDPAGSIGVEAAAEGLRVVGRHIRGPDEQGFSTVAIDGQPHRIRYRSSGLAPGDMIVLDFEEASSVRLKETPIRQA